MTERAPNYYLTSTLPAPAREIPPICGHCAHWGTQIGENNLHRECHANDLRIRLKTGSIWTAEDFGCVLWKPKALTRDDWHQYLAPCGCSYFVRPTPEGEIPVMHPMDYCDAFFAMETSVAQAQHKLDARQAVEQGLPG